VSRPVGERFEARAVVLTTGTFLNGLIHIGFEQAPGGRMGDVAAHGLSDCLRGLGFELGRLKTGTCRGSTAGHRFLRARGAGERRPIAPFSFLTTGIESDLVACHITYTNEKTHDLIRSGLDSHPSTRDGSGERASGIVPP